MNFLFLSLGFITVVFGVYFFLYPSKLKQVFLNLGIFIVVSIITTFGLFQDSIASKILENYDFEEKIERTVAEDFVADKFDATSYYSWYGIKHFEPVIIVKAEKQGKTKEIAINAFSGKVVKSKFSEEK